MELQRRADQMVKPYVPDVWMELNLTVAQLKSLIFVVCEERTSSRKLAAALQVTPSNVTGIVDRLVEQGFITRTQNPDDRRALLLQPTDKGQAALTKLRQGIETHQAEILRGMNVEELLTLHQGLSSLVRAAEQYEQNVDKEKELSNSEDCLGKSQKGMKDESD
ncbi:MAG: MarR family winged helix-turn-helix transcriptional regulator [Dehalococcoidia bacterium]